MANPILSVWRTIVRHSQHIPEPAMAADLRRVKRIVRNHRTHARRGNVRALFEVEAELRKVCCGEQSLAKARGRFQSAAARHANRQAPPRVHAERNQEAAHNLWRQHESRRFDEYNRAPARGSAAALAVDRRARVANATAAFLRKLPAELQSALARTPAADTVLAPFWHARRRATRGARNEREARPRPVDLTTLNRVGGTLSLLRVRGVERRGRGLRRHITAVSRDSLQPLRDVTFDLWLAKQYARDPLGDADMDEWIAHVAARKQELEARHRQEALKWEVQRRILVRRRAELERAWEWRFRRETQARDRQARLAPPPLRRLNTL